MSSSFRKTFVVKRMDIGAWEDGVYTPGATFTLRNIQASQQPLKPTEVQNLSEGRRTREPYWLITESKLNLASAPNQNPDRIVINDVDFEVESVESWQNGVVSHYKYLILKVTEA